MIEPDFFFFTFSFTTQIAGGTGLTPMLQVIEAILKNPDDKTQVYDETPFLYA